MTLEGLTIKINITLHHLIFVLALEFYVVIVLALHFFALVVRLLQQKLGRPGNTLGHSLDERLPADRKTGQEHCLVVR